MPTNVQQDAPNGRERRNIPQPTPYNNDDPYSRRWTAKATTLQNDNKLHAVIATLSGVRWLVAWGACPYCGHDPRFKVLVSAAVGLDAPSAPLAASSTRLRLNARRAADAEADKPVIAPKRSVECRCGESHPGAPEEGSTGGCGIRFTVELGR